MKVRLLTLCAIASMSTMIVACGNKANMTDTAKLQKDNTTEAINEASEMASENFNSAEALWMMVNRLQEG